MAAWSDHADEGNARWLREGCECDRRELSETDECVYASPCPDERTQARLKLPAFWEFFTDDALIELLADTSYELGRRGVRVLVG